MRLYGSGFYIELLFLQNKEEEHYHEDSELVMILDGEAFLYLSGVKQMMKSGDIVLVNGMETHRIETISPALCFRVFFSPDMFRQYLGSTNIFFVCNSASGIPEQYKMLTEKLFDLMGCCLKDKEEDKLDITISTLSVLQFIAQHFQLREKESGGEGKRSDELLAYINNNCGRKLDLKTLSEHFHLSYNYLSRYFKKTFGIDFISYLNRIRLERAKGMLIRTEWNVTDIAMECGFSSSSYFGKTFRNMYGCSPSEYRERYLQNARLNEGEKLIEAEAEIHRRVAFFL